MRVANFADTTDAIATDFPNSSPLGVSCKRCVYFRVSGPNRGESEQIGLPGGVGRPANFFNIFLSAVANATSKRHANGYVIDIAVRIVLRFSVSATGLRFDQSPRNRKSRLSFGQPTTMPVHITINYS